MDSILQLNDNAEYKELSKWDIVHDTKKPQPNIFTDIEKIDFSEIALSIRQATIRDRKKTLDIYMLDPYHLNSGKRLKWHTNMVLIKPLSSPVEDLIRTNTYILASNNPKIIGIQIGLARNKLAIVLKAIEEFLSITIENVSIINNFIRTRATIDSQNSDIPTQKQVDSNMDYYIDTMYDGYLKYSGEFALGIVKHNINNVVSYTLKVTLKETYPIDESQ